MRPNGQVLVTDIVGLFADVVGLFADVVGLVYSCYRFVWVVGFSCICSAMLITNLLPVGGIVPPHSPLLQLPAACLGAINCSLQLSAVKWSLAAAA